jgi:hypothetical protein
MNIIHNEELIHQSNRTIFSHLSETVKKLDDVVTQIYRESTL